MKNQKLTRQFSQLLSSVDMIGKRLARIESGIDNLSKYFIHTEPTLRSLFQMETKPLQHRIDLAENLLKQLSQDVQKLKYLNYNALQAPTEKTWEDPLRRGGRDPLAKE